MKKIVLQLTQGTRGSRSMKLLAQALTQRLGYKVWRSVGSINKPKKQQLYYGQGVDKISQYKWFEANNIPALEFTTDQNDVSNWLADGHVVIGRKLTNSSCGKGIVIFNPPEALGQWVRCPVYTKYKKKKREFRVHVFKDKVVTIVEKKQRSNWEGPRDTHIRNLANGYVFCQDVTNVPEGLEELAIKASKVVSSDFKGVDIGYNEKKKELFVIEVNAAPGMEGSRINKYVEAICEY